MSNTPSSSTAGHIATSAKAEEMIILAEKIVNCHHQLGMESPLKVQMIADLNYKCAMAKSKHEEAMKYKKLMEESLGERDQLLGLKNSATGTSAVSNSICTLVEILQGTQSEDKLASWGLLSTPSIHQHNVPDSSIKIH